MLKKSMLFAAVLTLVLLLAIAQLALAQQDMAPAQSLNTPRQDTSGTQTPGGRGGGEGQSTAPDPSGQNDASRSQPAAGAKGTPPDTSSALLMRLNRNNELVIDCPAVSAELAQLKATPANAAQSQAALVGTEELSRLCADGGFPAATGGGGSTQPSSNGTTGTTQPQQSQDTSTPADGSGGDNGSNPNGIGSTQPQQ